MSDNKQVENQQATSPTTGDGSGTGSTVRKEESSISTGFSKKELMGNRATMSIDFGSTGFGNRPIPSFFNSAKGGAKSSSTNEQPEANIRTIQYC